MCMRVNVNHSSLVAKKLWALVGERLLIYKSSHPKPPISTKMENWLYSQFTWNINKDGNGKSSRYSTDNMGQLKPRFLDLNHKNQKSGHLVENGKSGQFWNLSRFFFNNTLQIVDNYPEVEIREMLQRAMPNKSKYFAFIYLITLNIYLM